MASERQVDEQAAESAIDDRTTSTLVAARLRSSGYPFLWGIKCQIRDGVLVLSGKVPTFHLKQMAQALAARTPGVKGLQNDVHVTGSACGNIVTI